MPTVVDNSDNFYRAGFEKHSQGGTDVKLQKIDEEGTLLWTATVAASGGGAGPDVYEPTKIATDGTNIYVTGIVTYYSSGETDFFVSEVNSSGVVQWFTLDVGGNDVTSDILYDAGTSGLYVTGTTERDGDYDMLLAAYNLNGVEQWLVAKDYNGNADLGAVLQEDGGNFIVNGSSQQNSVQWDIASWVYDDGGSIVSHSRNTGLTAASHQLEDAAIEAGHINITGSAVTSSLQEFKVVCLDANTNYLWQNTYSKNSLPASGTAIIPSTNSFVAVGYVTHAANNENILVRKYNLSGTLLWSKEFDFDSANDRGVDIIEDAEGNYMILADVTDGAQKDVYIYYLDGINGDLEWSERVSDDAGLDETGISLEGAFGGEVYVTYEVNNLSVTEAYSYGNVDFPLDNEPFSKGAMFIANSGQLKYDDGSSAMEFRYSSLGLSPDYFFADDHFTNLIIDWTDDSVANDDAQRIDYDFINCKSTHVGHIEEHERETYFNYYHGNLKYEQQGTCDVLAYPDLYDYMDVFVSTNSAGFKMTLVLESGADLSDFELDFTGASGVSLSSGNCVIQTTKDDVVWLEPLSYPSDDEEFADDRCIEFQLVNGNLKMVNTCGELSYPYVIQIKVGPGSTYASLAIANMDWSTFYGGNEDDGSYDVTVNANGDIFVAGFFTSSTIPKNTGLDPNNVNGDTQGLLIKFFHNGEIDWAVLVDGQSVGVDDNVVIKTVAVHENLSTRTGEEIHVIGEFNGSMPASKDPAITSTTAYQQTVPLTSDNDLFFATFSNDGTRLIISPFGGSKGENVYAMDITPGGKMYFVGSTEKGGVLNSSSKTPPPSTSHTFPLYNANGDGSYYQEVWNGTGTRGFVAAIDLTNYELAYSSIMSDFKVVYDITAQSFAAFCGEGLSAGKLGFFDPTARMFASTLSQGNSDWSKVDYFSSVCEAPLGNVFTGINTNSPILSAAGSSPQFNSTNGDVYLLRFFENSVQWDTYFGSTAIAEDVWAPQQPFGIPRASVPINGKGKLDYNSSVNTFFLAGSAEGNSTHTLSRPGYFTETQNATSGPRADIFLGAFSNDISSKNVFTWGTMYGGNSTSSGLGGNIGNDFLGNLVTYDFGVDSWVVTTGSSTSFTGSKSSNVDEYPVAQLGPGSWFSKDNMDITTDIVITRFKVTDVDQGIGINELQAVDNHLLLYPNPTSSIMNISLRDQEIESIKIFNLSGKCVFYSTYQKFTETAEVNISEFDSGIYIIEVNGQYNGKVVKL